ATTFAGAAAVGAWTSGGQNRAVAGIPALIAIGLLAPSAGRALGGEGAARHIGLRTAIGVAAVLGAVVSWPKHTEVIPVVPAALIFAGGGAIAIEGLVDMATTGSTVR